MRLPALVFAEDRMTAGLPRCVLDEQLDNVHHGMSLWAWCIGGHLHKWIVTIITVISSMRCGVWYIAPVLCSRTLRAATQRDDPSHGDDEYPDAAMTPQ